MLVIISPATAFSLDADIITGELDQLRTDLTNDVEEETDSLQEEVEEIGDEVKDVNDNADEIADTVEDLEDDTFELVDNVAKTADSVSSEVEEVTGLVEDAGGELILEDDATGLVDGVEETADLAVEQVYELKVIQNPILTEKKIGEIIEEALDVPGLKEWSSDGWEFVSMDFMGETKPEGSEVEWERAIVYLHLPDGAGDPPEECFQGWPATIGVNLETGEVEDAGFPTEESHECTSGIVLDDPDAAAKPSFVLAEADDVASNDIYGNIAYLKTPSYKPEIFDHMDRYIAHLLNQKWKTFPTQYMTQIGWLITTVEGCASCGYGYIPANSSAIAFTDTSVFGNLEAHRIPVEWEPDGEMLAETICSDDENYLISVLYDGKIFNHNTKVPCDSADNDSKVSNSVFFENWNTVESLSWAQDITGKVQAHSAYEFMHSYKNVTPWVSSTNEEQACDSSRGPTAVIDGNLASGNVATWSELSKVPSAC